MLCEPEVMRLFFTDHLLAHRILSNWLEHKYTIWGILSDIVYEIQALKFVHVVQIP